MSNDTVDGVIAFVGAERETALRAGFVAVDHRQSGAALHSDLPVGSVASACTTGKASCGGTTAWGGKPERATSYHERRYTCRFRSTCTARMCAARELSRLGNQRDAGLVFVGLSLQREHWWFVIWPMSLRPEQRRRRVVRT